MNKRIYEYEYELCTESARRTSGTKALQHVEVIQDMTQENLSYKTVESVGVRALGDVEYQLIVERLV